MIILTLDIFFSAVIIVFLAELGDKTMLATIFLSAQYRRPRMVLLAAMLALTTSTIIAVIVGVLLSTTLPLALIIYLSGAFFILIGIYTLATAHRTEIVNEVSSSSFGGMFTLVFLAELGDKTQITALALAAQSEFPILIFLGAILGFLLVNGLGAAAGDKIADHAPIIWIKRLTGLVFIVFGLLSLFGVFN